jgi:hypothetical protein
MLQAEHVAGARIFVSARYSDGNGMINDNAGDIDRAALVCLEQAAPDVTVVTGPEDPALPTKSATGIRELPEGPLITFGRLDGMDDHTTSINIDRGGGDVRGAQYDVTTDATGAVHVKQNGQMWIS